MIENISHIQDGSSSEELGEPPEKRTKMNKTPITILRELCTQKKVNQPTFTEIDENSLSDNLKNSTFKFYIKCVAFSKSVIGGGVTKKGAQHTAADKLLKKIYQSFDSDDNDSDDSMSNMINNTDYITELLNLCVQKNFHKPEFVLTENYGPTHNPIFTFECRLDSLVRKGSANNKQMAKKIAAKNALDVLKWSYPDQEKKVMIINDQNMVKEEARRKITTYLELKCQDKTDKMGTLLSNRHNYFVEYKDEEFIESLKKILLKDIDSHSKYEEFTNELKTEWPINISNFSEGLIMFELSIQFEQFTVNLVSKPEDLEKTVIEYFMQMLHLVPPSKRAPSQNFIMEDIQLIPLSVIY